MSRALCEAQLATQSLDLLAVRLVESSSSNCVQNAKERFENGSSLSSVAHFNLNQYHSIRIRVQSPLLLRVRTDHSGKNSPRTFRAKQTRGSFPFGNEIALDNLVPRISPPNCSNARQSCTRLPVDSVSSSRPPFRDTTAPIRFAPIASSGLRAPCAPPLSCLISWTWRNLNHVARTSSRSMARRFAAPKTSASAVSRVLSSCLALNLVNS